MKCSSTLIARVAQIKRLVWFGAVVSIALNSPYSLATWHYQTHAIMGTEVVIHFWLEDQEKAKQAVAAVVQEMQRIDQTYSPYISTSSLSRLNQKASEAPQDVSVEMISLLDKALYMSQLSDGAFDITYASVGYQYDYHNKQVPSDTSREDLLPAINYRHVQLDNTRQQVSFTHSHTKIDLGGLAKGYAVDQAIDKLQLMGVQYASVSAGGDTRILGDRRGRPWIVGIKNPRFGEGKQADQESVIRLPLADVAISTSGDYERFFIDEDGQRIHHILNPTTGEPAKGVVSVTVIGPQGFDTDPLSTAVFVMGSEKGMALINRLPNFDCIIIDANGKVFYSDGLMASD